MSHYTFSVAERLEVFWQRWRELWKPWNICVDVCGDWEQIIASVLTFPL